MEVQDRGGGTEEEDIDDVGPIGGDEYAGEGFTENLLNRVWYCRIRSVNPLRLHF